MSCGCDASIHATSMHGLCVNEHKKRGGGLSDSRDIFLSSSQCKQQAVNDHRCQLKAKHKFLQIYRPGESREPCKRSHEACERLCSCTICAGQRPE